MERLSAGKRRFNIKLWKTFTDCFNCLPIAAIVDEKIFCCHGGLSPDLQSMEQIRRIMRPTDVPDTGNKEGPQQKQLEEKIISFFHFLLQVYYVIFCGPIRTRMFKDGERTIEASPSRSEPTSSQSSSTDTTWI